MNKVRNGFKRFSNTFLSKYRMRFILFGYALVILTGAVLLTLPISSRSGEPTNFLNALFTSTSATCVTGLVVYDTYLHWSGFGQIVILALIQIGGLSFMSIATLFSLLIRRTITLKERILIVESLNQNDIQGIVRLTKNILLSTLLVESLGAVLLWIGFAPDFGVLDGLKKGIFHSVSAFCNAGFDIMGKAQPFSNFTMYYNNALINIVITFLIIIGGLGFSVWHDVIKVRSFKKFSLHSKIAIVMTVMLLLLGTVFYFSLEYNNPGTMKNMNVYEKSLSSWFMSVTTRTAGFNTIPLDKLTTSSKFMTIILMFIGGSPGSTAGGIKTVTLGVLIAAVISVIRGNRDVNIFKRRLSIAVVMRAITVFLVAILTCILGIIIITIANPQFDFVEVCFEAISAFGTVGLSLGITPNLAAVSKVVLIILMYFGRVGVLTISLAFAMRMNQEGQNFKYPEGKVML